MAAGSAHVSAHLHPRITDRCALTCALQAGNLLPQHGLSGRGRPGTPTARLDATCRLETDLLETALSTEWASPAIRPPADGWADILPNERNAQISGRRVLPSDLQTAGFCPAQYNETGASKGAEPPQLWVRGQNPRTRGMDQLLVSRHGYERLSHWVSSQTSLRRRGG